jgi:hypothetical protein
MTPEAERIRSLAEDLALEILASYTPEDFESADFTASGRPPSTWPTMKTGQGSPFRS